MAEWNVYQKRNIIIFGRIGTGKKTMANQIMDSKIFEPGSQMESVTRKPTFEVRSGEDSIRKVLYNIALVDTVGSYSAEIPWKTISKDIWGYSSQNVPDGINLIIFVFRKGVYDDEEINIFKSIIKHFKEEIQEISAIVITGCEGLGDEGRKLLVKEIEEDETTGAIAQFMGKGIFPVGFPLIENVKEALREEYEKGIASDAETLIDLAKEAGEMTLRNDILLKKIKESTPDEKSSCQLF